jgi:monothiol glutaredoxin
MNLGTSSILERIQNDISQNDVVLYMKGTKLFPQCGFSATVISILQKLNIEFLDVNILSDAELRQGIKDFSNWPTIPQLYYKGEFVGGCDIIREMYTTGELHSLFGLEK